MKTVNIILMFVVALAIGACAPIKPIDPDCGDRTVTVNHRAASLDAHPEYVDLCSGDVLTIRLVPRVTVGNARTAQDLANSVAAAPWIAEENASQNRILITVPADTKVGIYKYTITIDGIGTLDPRARVTR